MNVNVYVNEKIAVKLSSNIPRVKEAYNVVTVHSNINVSSLTRILMVDSLTSNLVHTFEVTFTVIFT